MDDDMWGFSECDHYIGRGVALRLVNLSSLFQNKGTVSEDLFSRYEKERYQNTINICSLPAKVHKV
jgi:hypothetical protein